MPYHDPEPEEKQVAWNIASKQAQHISNLIVKSTSTYLAGNLGAWYWTLTALREMMNYDLDEDDRKLLDNMEKKINTLHSSWNQWKASVLEGKEKKELLPAKDVFCNHVKNYQRQIMDYLKELGYFPDKEDQTQI